jgi:hypothetical protein
MVDGLPAEKVDVISQDPDGLVQDDVAVGGLPGYLVTVILRR